MKDHIFEDLLRAERNRSLPECPSNIEANVLRRIRLASGEASDSSALDWIFGLLPQKGVAFSVLLLAVLLTGTSTMIVESSIAQAAESQNLAVSALDFGVFKEAPFFDLDN